MTTVVESGAETGYLIYMYTFTTLVDEANTHLIFHVFKIDEGKEIALHLRSQIEDLRQQLSDQELKRAT